MDKNLLKTFTRTAVLLALILAVQLLKNISAGITGPLVNAILIIATLSAGLWSGVTLSIVAPITSWLITGSPLMAATNFTLFPVIMIGNLVIVVAAHLSRKSNPSLIVGLIVGSVLKWIVMWSSVELVVKPLMDISVSDKMVAMLSKTFTHFQLFTALAGSFIAFLCWIPVKKYLKK